MVVVDTSALFAVECLEDEAVRIDAALRAARNPLVSAATLVELMIVLTRRRDADQSHAVEDLTRSYGLQVVAVDDAQMRLCWEAVARFGKGRHPAQLNFGDGFSYALARSRDLPLLFKGEDFGRTDVRVARY